MNGKKAKKLRKISDELKLKPKVYRRMKIGYTKGHIDIRPVYEGVRYTKEIGE